MKKILYVASEADPFVKTGGLGSVLGSLPYEINAEKYDVRLVIPRYECISQELKNQMTELFRIPVNLSWRHQAATIYTLEHKGIVCYFVGNDMYFCGDSPYSDLWADIEKYCFFNKAVLEMLAYMDYMPDIIHCHDWQSGLLPVYLKKEYGNNPYYQNIKTMITIHNLKFQGVTDVDRMKDLTGLPDDAFSYDCLENFGNANMLKGGIAMADMITTVSESYAEEILFPEFGENVESTLLYRKEQLAGIVNGIDYEMYNPLTDQNLTAKYSIENAIEKRRENKLALQKQAGLPADEKTFTMGIVSRLTDQKGYDLMNGVLDTFLDQGIQLFVLGGGQQEVEDIFREYKEKYPDQVYFDSKYKDSVAKMIYGGCDVTLMPSRFEPCGLNQLMALRYGCVPIVRATGGLKDTVIDQDEIRTGYQFCEFDGEQFAQALARAYETYANDQEEWNAMMIRGMQQNYSWKKSAIEYEKLYDQMTE